MTSKYYEQLKHPKWQKRRLQIMKRAEFACESCFDKDSTLHVHHRRYVKGRAVWDYPYWELACLCESCHQREHEAKEMMELALTSVPVGMISMHDLVSFICGFIVGTTEMTPWKLKDDDILYKIGKTWGFKDAFAFGLDARRKLVEHRLARARNAK